MEQKTSLYDVHEKYKGKIVPFAGYLLPVQYEAGVIKEHLAVRNDAGLFDVSHMGEIFFSGPDALANLNYLLTNDYTSLEIGEARYSPMCNEKGGCVDDLIVYRTKEDEYLVVVNAANKDKDYAWMTAHVFGDVKVEDRSAEFGQVAIQGPKAPAIVARLVSEGDIPEGNYTFKQDVQLAGVNCILARTGYTGEDGFEIYCPTADAPTVWEALMEAGAEDNLIPCGLGARDTLRLEASMPLYGHEMNDDISPREAGLGMFVKLDKEMDFIGKAPLIEAGKPTRRRCGYKITGKGIAREECPVFKNGKQIGVTTSGTHAPFLGYAIAMAIIDSEEFEVGSEVEIEVRGRRIPAEQIKTPFYKRAK